MSSKDPRGPKTPYFVGERICGRGSRGKSSAFGRSRSNSVGGGKCESLGFLETTSTPTVSSCNKPQTSEGSGCGPLPHFLHSFSNTSRQSRCFSSPNPPQRTCQSNVTPIWIHLGPKPDIQELFIEYDRKFFDGVLAQHNVTVEWSKRLKSTIGSCSGGYPPKIRLSEALLELRPVRDLVETLLHEMIHAYLFVKEDEFERKEHGPNFHRHMKRIDQLAGTCLTVDHPFHKEVKMNQYEWQCDGKCRSEIFHCYYKPPGPYDSWWEDHKAECGGRFILKRAPVKLRKKLAQSAAHPRSKAAASATVASASASVTSRATVRSTVPSASVTSGATYPYAVPSASVAASATYPSSAATGTYGPVAAMPYGTIDCHSFGAASAGAYSHPPTTYDPHFRTPSFFPLGDFPHAQSFSTEFSNEYAHESSLIARERDAGLSRGSPFLRVNLRHRLARF